MNEKFQALAAEAKQYARECMAHTMIPDMFSTAVFEQRFAELLVRAVAAEAHSRVCLEGNDNMIYDHLLHHFGLDPAYPVPMVFTFEMSDAYGDNYRAAVVANSESQARSIADLLDDDAVSGKLVSVVAQ